MTFSVFELTKDNEAGYLDKVAQLEQDVLENMESRGQSGQLFATGKEDISAYIHSEENSVFVAVDEQDKVIAATYTTQGQEPFTYNDITKYFKYEEKYREYVKSLYSNNDAYKMAMLQSYKRKIMAYQYAKSRINAEYPQYGSNILKFLQDELNQEENHFHEKSVLRELLNKYMAKYSKDTQTPEQLQEYEQFYWVTSKEVSEEFGTVVQPKSMDARECEAIIEDEYKQLIEKGPLVIHEKPDFDISKYFTANTSNAIELDTYLTAPNDRRAGLARILVFEGIKKHMQRHFEKQENKEIFLCSTLHRDNRSSKYVSEFFGLKDSLFVRRRYVRDREVHICKVAREEYKQYLEYMEMKIAVLYNYNPRNVPIPLGTQKQILEEQLAYEQAEFSRLNGSDPSTKTYNGNIDYKKSKREKIANLKGRLNKTNSEIENSRLAIINSAIRQNDDMDR